MATYPIHGDDMTNTAPQATNPQTINGVPDTRPGLQQAMTLAGGVIGRVTTDQLSLTTPCDGFTVEQLSAHSLAVLEQLVMIANGGTDWPDLVPDHFEPGEYAQSWARLSDDVTKAWSDDALLTATQVLPWAEVPGFIGVGQYISEVLVHAWDLARAIGVDVDWNQELAAETLVGVKMGLPVDGRDDPDMPFSAVVPTEPDALPMDQLVAYMGRNPNF